MRSSRSRRSPTTRVASATSSRVSGSTGLEASAASSRLTSRSTSTRSTRRVPAVVTVASMGTSESAVRGAASAAAMSSPTFHLPCSRLVGHASEDGSSRPSPSRAPCHDRAMAAEGTRRGSLPTRRELLRTAALTTVVAPLLAACDIRLEDDAPTLPLLQRKSVPDEAVLVDLVRRTTALAQAAGRVPNPNDTVSRLATIHQTQADVLRSRLTSAGVPNHVLDGPTATSTPTTTAPTAAVSAPPSTTPQEVAAAETALVAAVLPALPTVTAANRAVVASVVASCGAAAELLGATVSWPTADPLPPAAAVPLLDATRSAAYAFQVVAAQTGGDQRAVAEGTHTDLDSRAAQLAGMAGSSAPVGPLGYALPYPVTAPDVASRLAGQVLTTLVAGGLAPLATLPEGSTATTTLVRLLVDAQRLGRTWGVAPVPFPGQAYP